MIVRFLQIASLSMAGIVLNMHAGTIVNLNATVNGQAAPFGANPVNVSLGAGTYTVTPVGIAGGGLYDAWSAFSSNSGCLPDHTCVAGFETSFDYSYSGGYFNVQSGLKWDSPTQALAHSVSVTFTLAAGETVSFGLNDCAGCLGDNRGGASVEIVGTPEPATFGTCIAAFAMLASRWRRRQII